MRNHCQQKNAFRLGKKIYKHEISTLNSYEQVRALDYRYQQMLANYLSKKQKKFLKPQDPITSQIFVPWDQREPQQAYQKNESTRSNSKIKQLLMQKYQSENAIYQNQWQKNPNNLQNLIGNRVKQLKFKERLNQHNFLPRQIQHRQIRSYTEPSQDMIQKFKAKAPFTKNYSKHQNSPYSERNIKYSMYVQPRGSKNNYFYNGKPTPQERTSKCIQPIEKYNNLKNKQVAQEVQYNKKHAKFSNSDSIYVNRTFLDLIQDDQKLKSLKQHVPSKINAQRQKKNANIQEKTKINNPMPQVQEYMMDKNLNLSNWHLVQQRDKAKNNFSEIQSNQGQAKPTKIINAVNKQKQIERKNGVIINNEESLPILFKFNKIPNQILKTQRKSIQQQKNIKVNSNQRKSLRKTQQIRYSSIEQNPIKQNLKGKNKEMHEKKIQEKSKAEQISQKHPTKQKSQQQQNLKKLTSRKDKKHKKWVQVNPLKLQTNYYRIKKGNLQANQIKLQQNEPRHSKNQIKVPCSNKLAQFIKNYQPKQQNMSIDQLVRDQLFRVQTDEKYVFFGQKVQAAYHGFGVLIKQNYIFQGQWKQGNKIQGYEVTDQGTYKGFFNKNLRQGKGTFDWINGENYKGQWKKGLKSGQGIWTSPKGDCYQGSWANGQVSGQGTHTTQSGQKYEGDFRKFLKHGKGKQQFPNGDVFQGQFKEGQPNGYGIYRWKYGVTYKGYFKDGQKSGQGQITINNGFNFKGAFQNQFPNGYGQLIYPQKDTYKGQFKNGQRHGKGILSQPSKRLIFKGEWTNDKFANQD